MVRDAKILLACLPGFLGLMIGISNAFGFEGVIAEVTRTMSMENTWKIPHYMYRATDSAILIHAGAFFIIGCELLMGILCARGAYAMWQARGGSAAAFNASKRLAILGCSIGILLFFGGFLIIAGGWFAIWQGVSGPALATAFQYIGSIGIIMIFLSQPDS